MTVPVLTPLDSPIFDDDVIAEIESRLEEVPPCVVCAATAELRIEMRCCNEDALLCKPCFQRWCAQVAVASVRFNLTCAHCGADLWRYCDLANLVRVVRL
ncbi:hypothetical protein [Microbacterium sp. MMO-56]|uniref:hypothetical protein n=1 Tax=Microbacterium sp. MMO-56 TaxID=3081281 RepID=UPI003015EF4F